MQQEIIDFLLSEFLVTILLEKNDTISHFEMSLSKDLPWLELLIRSGLQSFSSTFHSQTSFGLSALAKLTKFGLGNGRPS